VICWLPKQSEPVTVSLDAPVNAAAWAPDGRRLAASVRGETVWILDGDDLRGIPIESEAESLAWSPGGLQLAAGCKDLALRVLDLRHGMHPTILTGHTDWIGALAWSPSGRILASGSDDRTVRLWNLDNPTEPRVLSGHHNYVDGISWSPDERFIASCSADWTIRIWSTAGLPQPDPRPNWHTDTARRHPARPRTVGAAHPAKHPATGDPAATDQLGRGHRLAHPARIAEPGPADGRPGKGGCLPYALACPAGTRLVRLGLRSAGTGPFSGNERAGRPFCGNGAARPGACLGCGWPVPAERSIRQGQPSQPGCGSGVFG